MIELKASSGTQETRHKMSHQFKTKIKAELIKFLFGEVLAQLGHQVVLIHPDGRHLGFTLKLSLAKKIIKIWKFYFSFAHLLTK